MKVVHIITTLVYGGAEKLLCNFTSIHADDHDIEIIFFKENPTLKTFFDPRIKFTQIPINFLVFHNLRKHLKKVNPNVIHTHLGHADLIGLWSSRHLKVKKFCTMHNIWFKWNWKDYIIFFLYRLIFRTVGKDCTVISISKSVKNHVENVLKVDKKKSILIYNGIPKLKIKYDRTRLRQELGILGGEFCLLFVGRLRVQKSVATLINAMADIRPKVVNIRLIILGVGELYEELKSLTIRLGVDDIIAFRGNEPQPEKYFEASDVFILPSVFEGLGLVVLEAFRSGIPVIASNVEGPAELITNNSNGLLFEPKNVKELGQCILKLYNDPSFAKKIGDNGYRTYSSSHKLDGYADTLNSLYNG